MQEMGKYPVPESKSHDSPCIIEWLNQFSEEFVQQAYDDRIVPFEMMNLTGTNLQHLNDYCLLEIFSHKSLVLIDLCHLAETCRQFHSIVQRIFPKELRFGVHQMYSYVRTSHVHPQHMTRSDVKRTFNSFGLISGRQRCDDNLKKLRISQIVFTVKLKPIFKRLQILHLAEVKFMGDSTLFAELKDIRKEEEILSPAEYKQIIDQHETVLELGKGWKVRDWKKYTTQRFKSAASFPFKISQTKIFEIRKTFGGLKTVEIKAEENYRHADSKFGPACKPANFPYYSYGITKTHLTFLNSEK